MSPEFEALLKALDQLAITLRVHGHLHAYYAPNEEQAEDGNDLIDAASKLSEAVARVLESFAEEQERVEIVTSVRWREPDDEDLPY